MTVLGKEFANSATNSMEDGITSIKNNVLIAIIEDLT